VGSQVNLQYFKFKQINKCIRNILKSISDLKLDGKALGCLMVIVMNANIKLRSKESV
jgi:N-acetylmuramic acid 6-phosphate (MurNAc-6-P) etherase